MHTENYQPSKNVLQSMVHILCNIPEPMPSIADVTSFIEEATILREFSHDNLVPVVGVSIINNSPYIITPLMENGDLRTFLRRDDTVCVFSLIYTMNKTLSDVHYCTSIVNGITLWDPECWLSYYYRFYF